MRVLLDTNVLVAAFATRGLCQDVLRTVLAEHQLVLGKSILGELERILTSKLRVPDDQIQEVMAFVGEHAEVVSPAVPALWPEDDPADRWVVAAALAGSAELVVSGDKALVQAARGNDINVVTPRYFLEAAAWRCVDRAPSPQLRQCPSNHSRRSAEWATGCNID